MKHNSITPEQAKLISSAHAQGMLNPGIAALAGVSISTVKRYRKQWGLGSNVVPSELSQLGKTFIAAQASLRGMDVTYPPDGGPAHLLINGQGVDVRTVRRGAGGRFQFWLTRSDRPSTVTFNYNAYHQRETAFVIFVCWPGESGQPRMYVFSSETVSQSLTIGPQNAHERHREQWDWLQVTSANAA